MEHYTRDDGGMPILLANCSYQGSRAPERWWDSLGLDHRSAGKSRHTSAPMMVFVPEGTGVATGGRFVKMFGFLLIILAG